MGGETEPQSKMAEELAERVFPEFRWERAGSRNQNWDCVDPKKHEGRTKHPTDVVYYYEEPYYKKRTYVICDLKSYGKKSISTKSMLTALTNLAATIECASKSDQWRSIYANDAVSYDVCGLLFVYNHDNSYKEDEFYSIIDKLKASQIDLPPSSKIVVAGPDKVNWINNIAYDIRNLRGLTPPKLPPRPDCKFHYPHLIIRKNIQDTKAATLEMLTSNWVLLEQNNEGLLSYTLYYRNHGNQIEEFYYLIDYLLHYQILKKGIKITVRAYQSDTTAIVQFDKAKKEFLHRNEDSEGLKALLDNIRLEEIQEVVAQFSPFVMGMP